MDGQPRHPAEVLEIHEYVGAVRCPVMDGLGPAGDVLRRIAFIPQSEVPVVRGDLDGSRQFLAVGHAQRQVLRLQACVDLIIQPGDMTELEGRAHVRRKGIQKRIEHREVLFKVRRELEQQSAELRS
jgi:hypothetical protein